MPVGLLIRRAADGEPAVWSVSIYVQPSPGGNGGWPAACLRNG
jgi:hypothetical protein